MLLEKSDEIDSLFNEFRNYKLNSKFLESVNSIVELEKALDSDFSSIVKNEIEEKFKPLVYNLILSMQNEAFKKIGKKNLIVELEKE